MSRNACKAARLTSRLCGAAVTAHLSEIVSPTAVVENACAEHDLHQDLRLLLMHTPECGDCCRDYARGEIKTDAAAAVAHCGCERCCCRECVQGRTTSIKTGRHDETSPPTWQVEIKGCPLHLLLLRRAKLLRYHASQLSPIRPASCTLAACRH